MKRSTWTIQVEHRAAPEPWEPELVVTVLPMVVRTDDEAYAVAVELRYDNDTPRVIGVAVRRHPRAGGIDRPAVSLRDVQRLSLRPRVDAAIAFAGEARQSEELRDSGLYLATPDPTPVRMPRGKPNGRLLSRHRRHRARMSEARSVTRQDHREEEGRPGQHRTPVDLSRTKARVPRSIAAACRRQENGLRNQSPPELRAEDFAPAAATRVRQL